MLTQARTTLSITGADAQGFLQNLVTNDLSKGDLTYAALLTPQGKYLVDFFVLRQPDGFVLDVALSHAAGLAQRLSMYKLRADVAVCESDLAVAFGTGPAPAGAYPDPRCPDLAWRQYGGDAAIPTDWDAFRVEHMIPETGIELTPDSFILEVGFERLNGVDFKKGCYVGQEVTARMKHKTELRKGLTQLSISGEVPAGTQITAQGKAVGTVYTQANGKALAHVRFDRVTEGMTAEGAVLGPL